MCPYIDQLFCLQHSFHLILKESVKIPGWTIDETDVFVRMWIAWILENSALLSKLTLVTTIACACDLPAGNSRWNFGTLIIVVIVRKRGIFLGMVASSNYHL